MAALVSSALRLLLALPLMAALGEGGVITVPRMTAAGEMADIYVRTPWYFDCSHHPEWSAFRQRFVDFRMDFANAERDSEEFFEGIMGILMEANSLGRRSEATFVEWASSWGIFHLCNDSHKEEVPEELTGNFCFYGFVVVQWLGLFGQQHFGNTPGMAEWAHNARGFLNDASKFNAMHFLESSGWPVKLVELAQTLSFDFLGKEHYRPARDAALPGMALLAGGQAGSWRESPPHTQVHGATKLKAVAISYHAALVREPLSFWMRALRHRFEVEASVHILDASARTPEDIRRLHSHCKFIDGAWCVSDERLLRLNEFFESKLLSCHTGDHKTGHHFISDAEGYFQLFIEMFDQDPEMRAADVFMCGEPVFFCRLLSHFGQPVIGYISTPLSVYINSKDRAQWYQSFYEMALDPRHFFSATTPVFAEWITYATGIALPVIRPAALFTDASYWPVRSREVLLLRTVSLFWDSECILNHFSKEAMRARSVAEGAESTSSLIPLRFVESTLLNGQERIGYDAFGEFLAAVIFPYAFSQFWFYELYAMGVPLYMPARETLPLYVNQDYAVCPDFEGHRPGHAPFAVHPHSPFDSDDWDAMTYWTSFTDYLVTPHISYFVSIPALLLLLETADHRKISREMRRVHAERVGEATGYWISVLSQVASIRGLPQGAAAAPPEPPPMATVFQEASGEATLPDELRDLSTRRPCGGSVSRTDGSPRKANDGDTDQQHPNEYHFDLDRADESGGASSSHWWVHLRRMAAYPEVKLWPRNCCPEAFGHRLWLLMGNSSKVREATECASLEVTSDAMLSAICEGVGTYFFVEARGQGGWSYQDENVAVLMLPEVRVLSRD